MVTSRMPIERVVRTALTVALIAACDRGRRDKPAATPTPVQAPASAASAPVVAKSCTLAPLPLVVPIKPRRVVAIGDLHGDLGGARSALAAAGAIGGNDTWIGGELVIVQTGDILDRGDDESKIFELFDKLTAQAKAAGGDIVQLHGNHELMNSALDFRYVTPGGMRDFGGQRDKAFTPGGEWAKRLARFNVVAIVDGTVYSHAGVTAEWVTQLDEVNLSSRCWFDGQAGGPGDAPIAQTSEDSPVWTRAWGIPGAEDCAALTDILTKLNAKRMVVGHTVQKQGITNGCDGKLWRIDVGLGIGYGGPIEVLEVSDSPRVLKGTR